ncbi:hypothetical protein GPECTOR_20g547 [Gonium pectorale]|uniref:proline--tRNA ligase n=1 Tax=Gonium pectorale TaxID=33097 RepID=A0A150GJN4_GONPE|nr:hypothetical protein GPECTOR_20g547 [Gonium pectorale]|eukprot:KXZ49690.1 hypothetical protein GPECTOR_20g547 [Gonium pectorale]
MRTSTQTAPAGATARQNVLLRPCRGPVPFNAHSRVVVASAAPATKDAPAGKQQKQKQGGGGGGGKAVEAAVTPRSEDFSKWYLDVVAKAELADYGPVRGTMVIRPYGYAIWEAIQATLDGRFKELGVENAYFPQLIPLSFIAKEAEHVEGFAPELALVTKGGAAGTSHNLGSNFAAAFGTQYLDSAGKRQLVHQSSWGVSTRLIGGLIMTHGDDKGLRLPPRLAPVQVVIIPIVKKEEDRVPVGEAAQRLAAAAKAAGIRVKVDADERQTPGWKYNHWEMRGVPIRVEVGPKDVASGTCVTARRDMPGKEGKQMGVPMEAAAFVAHLQGLMDSIQAALTQQATAFRDDNIVDVKSYEELKEAIAAGKWARGGWAASDDDERRVKEETQATLRCFPFDQPPGPHTCLMTGQPASEVAIFAKSY